MATVVDFRNRAQNYWASASQQRKMAILGGVAALLAGSVGVFAWSNHTDYSVVYSGLSPRMGGNVIAALQKESIPYRLENGGNLIEVPTADAARVRLQLAEQGLPAQASSALWGDLQHEKLGTSSFVEHTTYLRALESSLAKDITSIHGVESASVNLAIPQHTPFLETMPKPKAAVTVDLMPGVTLTHAQVFGITHLVASSVPGLKGRDVTVVDQNGRALTSKSHGAAASTVLQLQESVEAAYKAQIVSLLSPLVGGAQNLRVVVDANLDQSHRQESSVTYGMGHVVTAAVMSSREKGSASSHAFGIPGALSNQPPGNPTAPITAKTASTATLSLSEIKAMIPRSQKDSRRFHYVLDKTVGFKKDAAWRLKTLSVSVVINGAPAAAPVLVAPTAPVAPVASATSGKKPVKKLLRKSAASQVVHYSARTLSELQKMVNNAIHASAPQGTVQIAAIPFQAPVVPHLAWWQKISPWAVWHNLEWFLFGLIALFIIRKPIREFFSMRVAETRRQKEEQVAAVAAEKAAIEEEARKAAEVPVLVSESGVTLDLRGISEGQLEDNMDRIKELIRTDTARAVEVVREWIGNNPGEENG